MNRRRMIAGCVLLPIAFAARTAAGAPEAPEQIPMTPAAVATPPASRPVYAGDVAEALRSSPWELEGKTVELRAVVRSRYTAEEGSGFAVDTERREVYRSLLYVTIPPTDLNVAVATNADISEIHDLHTAQITGTYGGIHEYVEGGGRWTVPLVLASSVTPVAG